jgi:hypothetical protein
MAELVITYNPREHDDDAYLEDNDWWTEHGGPRVDALENLLEQFQADTGMSAEGALTYLLEVLADRIELQLETRLAGDKTQST